MVRNGENSLRTRKNRAREGRQYRLTCSASPGPSAQARRDRQRELHRLSQARYRERLRTRSTNPSRSQGDPDHAMAIVPRHATPPPHPTLLHCFSGFKRSVPATRSWHPSRTISFEFHPKRTLALGSTVHSSTVHGAALDSEAFMILITKASSKNFQSECLSYAQLNTTEKCAESSQVSSSCSS
jgi:hypothetical protein